MGKSEDLAERAFHEAFRARLVRLREVEMGWTQAKMAEYLGVPLANYKKYEKRSKFPPHLYSKLAGITHRNLEWVVTGQGPNLRIVRQRAAT